MAFQQKDYDRLLKLISVKRSTIYYSTLPEDEKRTVQKLLDQIKPYDKELQAWFKHLRDYPYCDFEPMSSNEFIEGRN